MGFANLIERLRSTEHRGRFAPGGGSIDAKGHGTAWGGEKIMERRNPDGPEVAAAIETLMKWREGGILFDALCRVRCRNAADFSGTLTSAQSEAYDKAVLACFAEIEATLKAAQ